MMIAAVFGDLHGKIKLAYRLCQRWQREHQQALDLILQVGDLGFWPDITRLDQATMRFASKDMDELGFLEFYEGSQSLDRLFEDQLPDLYFIKGNHEDFDLLEEGDEPVPVDAYHKILYLPNGITFSHTRGSEELRVSALGGIGGEHDIAKRRRHKKAYFTDSEIQRLCAQGDTDILLTHHGDTAKRGCISLPIQRLRKSLDPAYHFYGHLHKEEDIEKEKRTSLVQLNQLAFRRRSGILPRQAFGILHWKGRSEHRFDFVDDEWMRDYTEYTWEDL